MVQTAPKNDVNKINVTIFFTQGYAFTEKGQWEQHICMG